MRAALDELWPILSSRPQTLAPARLGRKCAPQPPAARVGVSRNPSRAPTASLRDRLRRHLTEPVRRKTRRSEHQSGDDILVAVQYWLDRLPVWQDAMLCACMGMAGIKIMGA